MIKYCTCIFEIWEKTPYIALYFKAFYKYYSSIIFEKMRGYPQFSVLDFNSAC